MEALLNQAVKTQANEKVNQDTLVTIKLQDNGTSGASDERDFSEKVEEVVRPFKQHKYYQYNPWTKEEKAKMYELFLEHGPKVNTIWKQFPHRACPEVKTQLARLFKLSQKCDVFKLKSIYVD